MTKSNDQHGAPPPEPPQSEPTPSGPAQSGPAQSGSPDPGNPPGEQDPSPSASEVRDALFTGTLQAADRMVNRAEALRLQVMLAGLDAMVLEEQPRPGAGVRMDDPIVKGFFLHQANELRTTRFDIEHRLADARMLRDHLPATWAVFLDGGCSERAALVAARAAIGLNAKHHPVFDEAAARLVQEERPSAVQRQLDDLRDSLDPDATDERHTRATNRRWVRARAEGDGQGVLEIHSTATDIAAAYDRIRARAVAAHGREGECRTLGNLMVDAAIDAILTGTMRGPGEGGPSYPAERLGETVDPTRRVIDATILVVVPAETATGATNTPGEVAGMGRIDAETSRAIVAHTRTWTRVAVDPVDDAVIGIDSHERYIPAGLRKLLHFRQRTCGCGCGLPAHRADVDHVQRYEHDGRTRHDNLQVLCRESHQAKDAGFADVTMQADGRIKWKDKWGGVRTVRPTVKIKTKAEPPTYPAECPF